MVRFTILSAAILITASLCSAAPLGVRIVDHDFTFDSDFIAKYNFNGATADTLTIEEVPEDNPATQGIVSSYRFNGLTQDFAGNGTGFFPIWEIKNTFGGDMDVSLSFSANDGPFNAGGTSYPISLTGAKGSLLMRGILGVPPGFTPPPGSSPEVLLQIDFNKTSLIGRDSTAIDGSVIDLVEASGTVRTVGGQNVLSQGLTGVIFFKFMAPAGTTIFQTSNGAAYDPLASTTAKAVTGRASGETGLVPEPVSLSLLLLGLPALLRRTRK